MFITHSEYINIKDLFLYLINELGDYVFSLKDVICRLYTGLQTDTSSSPNVREPLTSTPPGLPSEITVPPQLELIAILDGFPLQLHF